MPKKEVEIEEEQEAPEFAAVSIASLTVHFDGDAHRAQQVMDEIGEAGGFGRAHEGSVFALIAASDEVQKQALEIIKKNKKESSKK